MARAGQTTINLEQEDMARLISVAGTLSAKLGRRVSNIELMHHLSLLADVRPLLESIRKEELQLKAVA